MRKHTCPLAVMVAAAASCLLPAGNHAADEKEKKDVKAAILKLADAIEKDDPAEAKKQLEALRGAKADEIMVLLAPRSKGGIGVGAAPTPGMPDGIEARLIAVSNRPLTPGAVAAQAKDLARMAYVMAAVGEAVQPKCTVPRKVGDKDPKDWKKWSQDMREQSAQLAKTLQEKKPDAKAVKAAAIKAYGTCTACHGPFRE